MLSLIVLLISVSLTIAGDAATTDLRYPGRGWHRLFDTIVVHCAVDQRQTRIAGDRTPFVGCQIIGKDRLADHSRAAGDQQAAALGSRCC